MTQPLTVQLRCAEKPMLAIAAWRLPGSAPADWLERIAAWGAPHDQVRLMVLPTSPTDRTPDGALVQVQGSLPTSPPSIDALPFGVLGSRLFVPVDSQLWPAISEDELIRMTAHRTYVWQPHMGLVAMEGESWLPLSKFIARPSWTLGDWDVEHAGLVLAPHITSLRADLPPDADAVLQDGQEDIGSRTDAPDEMPQSPDESNPGPLSSAKNQAKKLAAGAAGAVSNLLPGNWAERLGSWAERQREKADRTMEADRNREMERLMNLMETNPDEGLRYAPPLSEDTAPRGRAEPSGSLGERDPTFNFGRLTRSGPGQSWDVSGNYYYKLRTKYREAANRELQLKRYRRAAYIFGELLGDFPAAAGALTAGKCFREAAALYQQKLNSPQRAAECLEQGGLLTEAIEIYTELELFEKAGDLHDRLDQSESARRLFRLAVIKMQARETARDHLAIAHLLLGKLGEKEEALHELSDAWPTSPNNIVCLQKWFDIVGRDHDEARMKEQIERIGNAMGNAAFAGCEILVHVAQSADRASVGRAQDALRSLIARQLPETQPTRRRQLVEYLQQLFPADRLLRRDCRNFLERRGKEMAALAAPALRQPRRRDGRNTLVATTKLPPNVNWTRMCMFDDVVFVAGIADDGKLSLVNLTWFGDAGPVEQPWGSRRFPEDSELLLSAPSHHDSILLLQPLGQPSPLLLKPIRGIKRRSRLRAGSTGGIISSTLAVDRGAHGNVWSVAFHPEQLVLQCFKDDVLVSSKVLIDEPYLSLPSTAPQIGVSDANVYVSWGDQLLVAGPNDRQDVFHDLPNDIRRLACSAPHSRSRVAIGYEFGGALIWNQPTDFKMIPFGDGLIQPEVCINRGGFLIAAGSKRLEVYSTKDMSLTLIGENEDAELDPIEVIGGPSGKQFAVLNGNGELQYFECSP